MHVQIRRGYTRLSTLRNARSEGECSKCARYQKHIDKLQKVLKDEAEESVRQYLQQERKISKLTYERLFADKLLKNFKAEIESLKVEYSSGSQNKRKMLEEVAQPESNTLLRVPDSLYLEVKDNEHWL